MRSTIFSPEAPRRRQERQDGEKLGLKHIQKVSETASYHLPIIESTDSRHLFIVLFCFISPGRRFAFAGPESLSPVNLIAILMDDPDNPGNCLIYWCGNLSDHSMLLHDIRI